MSQKIPEDPRKWCFVIGMCACRVTVAPSLGLLLQLLWLPGRELLQNISQNILLFFLVTLFIPHQAIS